MAALSSLMLFPQSQIRNPKSEIRLDQFAFTFTLSTNTSASVAFPNSPGLPLTLGVSSAASIVHSPG
jgi:hypothetical protein